MDNRPRKAYDDHDDFEQTLMPSDIPKGPVFTVCVKSFPFYHFNVTYVVLYMAVKEFFDTHF